VRAYTLTYGSVGTARSARASPDPAVRARRDRRSDNGGGQRRHHRAAGLAGGLGLAEYVHQGQSWQAGAGTFSGGTWLGGPYLNGDGKTDCREGPTQQLQDRRADLSSAISGPAVDGCRVTVARPAQPEVGRRITRRTANRGRGRSSAQPPDGTRLSFDRLGIYLSEVSSMRPGRFRRRHLAGRRPRRRRQDDLIATRFTTASTCATMPWISTGRPSRRRAGRHRPPVPAHTDDSHIGSRRLQRRWQSRSGSSAYATAGAPLTVNIAALHRQQTPPASPYGLWAAAHDDKQTQEKWLTVTSTGDTDRFRQIYTQHHSHAEGLSLGPGNQFNEQTWGTALALGPGNDRQPTLNLDGPGTSWHGRADLAVNRAAVGKVFVSNGTSFVLQDWETCTTLYSTAATG